MRFPLLPSRASPSKADHASDALALCALVDEIRRDHILHGDAHRLIDGDLVLALASWPTSQQHLAELGSPLGIEALKLGAADGRRLKRKPRLHEQAMTCGDQRIELAGRRRISDRGQMHAGP